MSKLRVFISHSTKEERAENFLSALQDALEHAPGEPFEVLLDRQGLEPGDLWRSKLNLWIGGCDAAIVLLSPHALKSAYVAYETSILSYRKSQNLSFPFFTVLFPDVGEKEVRASALSPAQLTELQAFPFDENNIDATIERIKNTLAATKQNQTPAERFASEISIVLGELDNRILRAQLDALGQHLRSWTPTEDLAMALALALAGIGLPNVADNLRSLRDRLKGSREEKLDKLKLIFELIAASWVDCKAAATLAAATGRDVAINAIQPLTARMYVNVSSLLKENFLPTDAWKVVDVPAILGEADIHAAPPELIDSVEQALTPILNLEEAVEFQEGLRDYLENEPVFVALPILPGFQPKWLGDLRTAFPGVTFFLLTGTGEIKSPLREIVEVLEPPLAAGNEEHFCDSYRKKYNHLIKGWTT